MTRQCVLVLRATQFPIDIYRELEMLLTDHMAKQVINCVWNKDPRGIHDWNWFRFIKHYLPRAQAECIVKVEFTEEFWETYDVISLHLRPFGIQSMPLISEMKDLKKVKMVLPYSRSLYQLYDNYKKVPEFNIPIELEKHKVKRIELN